MKPIFKNYSLQNLFVLCVGYFGLIFVRKSFQYWDDGELLLSILNGSFGYFLFGSLLGFPPFSKLMKWDNYCLFVYKFFMPSSFYHLKNRKSSLISSSCNRFKALITFKSELSRLDKTHILTLCRWNKAS